MEPHITGNGLGRGAVGRDNRLFVEAVLWMVRTGSVWRDLPDEFGDWNNVFRRFTRWSNKGLWHRIFAVMRDDSEFNYTIDNDIVMTREGRRHRGLKITSYAAAVAK
jgi:transposase